MAAMPGAVALVRRLAAAGLQLAVATSSGVASARSALQRLGVAQAFSALLTIEDVRRAKPDPEIYRLAARRLGLAPCHLVAVEDSPHGIAAARAAGLACIALAGAWTPAEKLAAAQVVVQHLDQVPGLIRRLPGPLPPGRQKA
ncbi:MAG: HAD-IA family hydrolase [Acidobacteriota bacterium]|nr:HAD-IA family hydrolase [Acidobacteriota bacterium]